MIIEINIIRGYAYKGNYTMWRIHSFMSSKP